MQFRLLENKGTPKWEISRWTYSPEKKRAIKETLGSFPCYYSLVSRDILDKCTTQGFVAEILARDSVFESSLLAVSDEQAEAHTLPNDELVLLQRSTEEAWVSDGVV